MTILITRRATAMLDTLLLYFKTYPVVSYATAVLVLVSLCSAMLGVVLVLKRYSMIGDGLSHVAFGGTAIATVTGFAPTYIALPITVAAAVLLLRIKESSRIKGDAAIAMIATGALAIGYLLLNVFPENTTGITGDACTALFGSVSIIGISLTDVIVCAAVAVVLLTVFVLFYNKIFAITFDESFAAASGTKVSVYNTFLAAITGAVIVIAMNMVGALLISALITFPALSAMRVFKTFKRVVICAAIISVACAVIGTLTCIMLSTPVGPTVAVANLLAFIGFSVAGFIRNR